MITAIRSHCRYRNEPAPNRHRWNRIAETVLEGAALLFLFAGFGVVLCLASHADHLRSLGP